MFLHCRFSVAPRRRSWVIFMAVRARRDILPTSSNFSFLTNPPNSMTWSASLSAMLLIGTASTFSQPAYLFVYSRWACRKRNFSTVPDKWLVLSLSINGIADLAHLGVTFMGGREVQMGAVSNAPSLPCYHTPYYLVICLCYTSASFPSADEPCINAFDRAESVCDRSLVCPQRIQDLRPLRPWKKKRCKVLR